jgi:hypothetical protein
MVFTVGMTNTLTHPEDRPWTFELPEGRDWLEPGDADYGWVLDDLREHFVIGWFLDRIVARDDSQPADAVLPQIAYGRRRRIELTWCNVRLVFAPTRWAAKGRSYKIVSDDIDWSDVRPDGKIMVWCDHR